MDQLLSRSRGSGRNARQARDRYMQHLAPDLKPAGAWSVKEEQLLIQGHAHWGRSWARLAQRLPGRSPAAIKNHWCVAAMGKGAVNPPARGQLSRARPPSHAAQPVLVLRRKLAAPRWHTMSL
jgi:hypothetical protein